MKNEHIGTAGQGNAEGISARAKHDDEKRHREVKDADDVTITASKPTHDKRRESDNPSTDRKDWAWWLRSALEIAGLGIAIWIGFLTLGTLREIKQQTPAVVRATEIANQNFESSQRAYLGIGKVEESLQWTKGVTLNIPIENYGHVPIRKISATMQYFRVGPKGAVKFRSYYQSERQTTIAPGANHTILVFLPFLSPNDRRAVQSGEQSTALTGRIYYDTGFGKDDTTRFLLTYDPQTRNWAQGPVGNDIDLRIQKKDDKE